MYNLENPDFKNTHYFNPNNCHRRAQRINSGPCTCILHACIRIYNFTYDPNIVRGPPGKVIDRSCGIRWPKTKYLLYATIRGWAGPRDMLRRCRGIVLDFRSFCTHHVGQDPNGQRSLELPVWHQTKINDTGFNRQNNKI